MRLNFHRVKMSIVAPLFAVTIAAGAAATAATSQNDCRPAEALPSDEEIAAKISDADQQRDSGLNDYSVIRKYNLHNSHLKNDAEMTVRLSYHKGQGKSFEVLDLQNAEGMSKKVLQRLIDSEAEASRERHKDQLDITKANYNFHVTGVESHNGRRCYVVNLIPKRKSKYLVQGKAFVDVEDYGILRVEGRPSASLSFWVGKPYIVLEFHKVGQFWMAAHNRSESQSMVLGASVLTIDYSGYTLNAGDIKVADNHNSAPKRTAIE